MMSFPEFCLFKNKLSMDVLSLEFERSKQKFNKKKGRKAYN